MLGEPRGIFKSTAEDIFERAMTDHWGREHLAESILDALATAGKNLDALTMDDLAVTDQFHGGGKPATTRLAKLCGVRPGLRVLDVGGGLGGPARTLAAEYGCRVTVLDVTESYARAGRMLTARLGLEDRVRHGVGDALALPSNDGAFDLVWTQNSGMNLADKERLYAGFHRVLRRGGVLALQEPMAGPTQPPVFPLMWADDAGTSFLRPPDAMRALIARAGFVERVWDDVTDDIAGPATAEAIAAHSAQRLIMGARLEAILRSNHRNRTERRIVSVQAVFDRP